jgi:perosamine synthetase
MSFKKDYFYGKQSISWSDVWEVIKVLRSSFVTQGPKVLEFEKAICDYTGAKYAIVVSNGTAALHLSMLALGISKEDEVITSTNTFLASANCILYVGGNVVFADIDSKTACIDSNEIEKKITKKTKAIIPVHFAGQSCDMEKIQKIEKKYNLFIVEDAAHAIGSDYKGNKVGCCRYSDMCIFSFFPTKNITTGEGGAITTNNKELYERLLKLRSHGVTRDRNLLIKDEGPWYYEMQDLGFNYRMTDIQAALGLSQLKKIEKFKKKRRELVVKYKKEFANDERFSFLEEKKDSDALFHIFPLLINFEKIKLNKKQLFEELKTRGLYLQVHFIPVHLQPFYKKLGFKENDYPKAENYYKQTISLPLYPTLKNKDITYITDTIKKIAI